MFFTRQVLINGSPALIVVPGETLTSATKLAWSHRLLAITVGAEGVTVGSSVISGSGRVGSGVTAGNVMAEAVNVAAGVGVDGWGVAGAGGVSSPPAVVHAVNSRMRQRAVFKSGCCRDLIGSPHLGQGFTEKNHAAVNLMVIFVSPPRGQQSLRDGPAQHSLYVES